MGHNPNKIVKTKERKQVLETRSPEDIIKGIRGNLVAHLSVTPSDIAFLLKEFDVATAAVEQLGASAVSLFRRAEAAETKICALQEKLDEFRAVYDAENRNVTVTVSSEKGAQAVATGFNEATALIKFQDATSTDFGGEA